MRKELEVLGVCVFLGEAERNYLAVFGGFVQVPGFAALVVGFDTGFGHATVYPVFMVDVDQSVAAGHFDCTYERVAGFAHLDLSLGYH